MTKYDESYFVEEKQKEEHIVSSGETSDKQTETPILSDDQKKSPSREAFPSNNNSMKQKEPRRFSRPRKSEDTQQRGVGAHKNDQERKGSENYERHQFPSEESFTSEDNLPFADRPEQGGGEGSEERSYQQNRHRNDRFKKQHHRVIKEKKPVQEMNLQELMHHARKNGILGAGFMNKAELLEKISYIELHPDLELEVEGVLEKLPDGFGFLRSRLYDYTSSPDDVYVSPSQIRRFGLRNGDIVRGVIRKLREEERYFALLKVSLVNFEDPIKLTDRPSFDSLIPVYPHDKFMLEFDPSATATRLMDLFTPIGKGQRGLIVAPPKVGKTILLKELARAIMKNHPETFLIVLHIDERPEEVADMRRTVHDGRAEVISSTFDETAERHVQVAELALEKAKRLVECGYDVVILLDSITRLARAYNTIAPTSGKVLTGGIDANALQRPKRFFGAARCIEKMGSSLTIIATALVETGSKMDEVIFEEFKGTGNMEINMTRKLSNRRIFPSFDLSASGTRRDELLLPKDIFDKVFVLHKLLGTMNTAEGMEFLITQIKKTKTNEEFLEALSKKTGQNGTSSLNL